MRRPAHPRLRTSSATAERRDLPEVQVGAQARDVVGLGLVVVAVVARQPVRQETPQPGAWPRRCRPRRRRGPRRRCGRSSTASRTRRRLVESQAGNGHAGRWRPHRGSGAAPPGSRAGGGAASGAGCGRRSRPGSRPPRSARPRRFPPARPGTPPCAATACAPGPLVPQVAAVAHDQRRVPPELQRHPRRGPDAAPPWRSRAGAAPAPFPSTPRA